MDPLEETRQRLECQVNEFFSPTTPNERKQQIGQLLENFSKQDGSWKQALYFLSSPESFNNAYLSMFCLTVIENSVKGRWLIMSTGEKAELHTTLYNFLITHASASSSTKCPHFVRNKIIKILVDVGKFSWPNDHPNFLNNVLEITSNDDTVTLGLLFLKTISEEWSACKDEISTDRKFELKILLIRELKRIFDLLYQILATGLKHCGVLSLPNNSSSSSSNQRTPLPPALKEVFALSLETCASFFSWIPFDGTLALPSSSSGDMSQSLQKSVPFTTELVTVLCQYAAADTTALNEADGGVENLSILALGVLNELLYRKYVPKELDGHINLVTSYAVDLLCKMFTEIGRKTITHKYIDKGIELLCLIANSYFFRYDKETSKQFITLLLNFTFAQNETVFYYECLEIWKLLVDHLISEVPFANYSCREELLDHFKPILLDLALGIVNSTIKFDVDEDSQELYEDEDDEDMEILSLSKNVDVLIKIGELLPTESLERVTSTWTSSCQYFENLQNKLDQSKTVIMLENQTDIKHFSFVVQLIGRIAEIFYGDVFKNELDRGKALVHQLLGLIIISKNFYFVRTSDALIQACCEIIYALRTWTYWLARYYSEVILTDCTPADVERFNEILTVSADGLRFSLDNHTTIHPNLQLANANFFSLLVNCIRTQHIFKLPWVQTLINQINSLRGSLREDTFRVCNKAVSILLLLPWQNSTTAEQEWDFRTGLYNQYMKNLMDEILSSANNSEVPKLLLSIRILNDQLDILQTECAVSKKICWTVFSEIVPYMHKLIPVYVKRADVSQEILNFFLKIFEVLSKQSGAHFFEETVRIFLGLFTSANIINDLMKDAESSAIVVEKFLKMLEFMIKDPSPSFKKFLPDCLSVALDHIYPVLARRSSPDVKLVFFQFVRDVVNYRWNYFFPGFLYAAPSESGNSPSSVSEEDKEKSRRLYQIFETLGHSFLQSDLEVFRFNLNTLSIWNQKHQIYSRMVIDLKMFDGFMSVLVQVLASKSHDLLKEEIAFNLYEMSLVDFARFWQVFLPQTLQKDFPLLSLEQRLSLAGKFKPKESFSGGSILGNGLSRSSGEKIDLTGFTMTLYRFTDDLRFYHFYNNHGIEDASKQQPSSSSSP